MKNNPVCKENASNVFRKEREQYHEIQDFKAQMQDKNMVINELKKLILVTKGKSVETQFDKPSVVRQPNAQRIPKPSVLGKPTPFSNSPEMRNTQQSLPQIETNDSKHRIASTKIVIHTTSVSNQIKCYQVKDKVVPKQYTQVKFQKKKVIDHHKISSISKKTKACTGVMEVQTPELRMRMLLELNIVQLILFIVDSGCTKHMTGNLKLLCNFVEKFLGTVRFRNDQFAPILGYGDLIQGNGNLLDFFTNSTWFMGSKTSHLTSKTSPYSKEDIVTGLPKLTYVKDQLCSSCEMSKAKRSSFKSKAVPSSKGRLNLLHMDLCGPMRVASINGKKYILVIVDTIQDTLGLFFYDPRMKPHKSQKTFSL
ncbi:hypothetical protein Tco_0331581 [Tanacetum coccineum]